jgi:three-Cys-motif partner protein
VKGVAFLDPYGPNLEWETVATLAASKQFEVIINLPVHMAINRLLAKDAERNPEWEAMIDRCYGTTDWRDLVYPKVTDMFGDTTEAKADGVPDKLKDLYMTRLKAIFAETAPAKLIRNTKGSPLYYLIWAGPHKQGRIGAEYVLGSKNLLAKKNRT